MNTLIERPLGPLLERLFAVDAERTLPIPTDLTREQMLERVRSKTEYRRMYASLSEIPMAVSRTTGRLLYMLARSARAQTIVEFGTSFGISTLHLAAALRDNGGGRLIATEFEPSKVDRARAHLVEGGLADLVELRVGDAIQTLAQDLPPAIDLVLLDGAKALYRDVLDLLEPKLRPGAMVVADNADMCPEYADYVRSSESGYVSVGVDDDVLLSVRA